MRPQLLHHRLRSLAVALGLAVLASLIVAAPVHAQSCQGQQVVQSAAASLNQAASSGSPQAFAAVVDRHADVSQLAMFALGPYRRALPAGQRSEYVQLTRRFLGSFLAQRAGSFAGSRLEIVGCSRDGNFSYVDSRVGGQRVVWRIGGGRIADVNVGGVWLAPQMRSNFVSVIRRGDGDVAALMQYLRDGRFVG